VGQERLLHIDLRTTIDSKAHFLLHKVSPMATMLSTMLCDTNTSATAHLHTPFPSPCGRYELPHLRQLLPQGLHLWRIRQVLKGT
jgi:hypothetical protein